MPVTNHMRIFFLSENLAIGIHVLVLVVVPIMVVVLTMLILLVMYAVCHGSFSWLS
jgi:hypothetical protein